MVDKGFNIIDEQFSEFNLKLESSKKKNYKLFQKKYHDEDKELIKELEENTEILILNNTP